MPFRPSCFELLFMAPSALLLVLAYRLVMDGALSPQSNGFRPLLACVGCAFLIYGLGIAALLLERRRK